MPRQMTTGNKVIKFIETHCFVPEGNLQGEPFKLLGFQKNFIREIYDNPEGTRHAYLSIGRRNGKALALDTPIPTPTGWRTMGELAEGDQVFDEHGKPCNVTFVTPVQYNRDCFRVEFADGSSMIADADHQWTVNSRYKKGRKVTLTTADMYGDVLSKTSKKNERNYSVDIAKPVDYPHRDDLLIDPYTLGVWLGDGHSAGARLTIAHQDIEIIDRIKSLGHPVKSSEHTDSCACYTLTDGVRNRMKDCFQKDLRTIGVLNNKHIPENYRIASIDQRTELLRGIMDTDGYVSKAGQCVLSLCNEKFALDALELIRSLGYKATFRKCDAKINGRFVGYSYNVQFWSFKSESSCFHLQRKHDRLKDQPSNNRTKNKKITAIDPVNSVPVKCIQVDSPNSLYLAGEAYTVTHNTGLIACLLIAHLIGPVAVKNSQIISGARSRDQASLVFNLAKKIIEANPALSEKIQVIPSRKTLIGLFRGINTEYTALAAEGSSNLGRSPILAILDEVGAIKGPQDDFVDSITTAQGSHAKPLLIAISTQAPTDEALFSTWIDDARNSDDPHTVCHVYTAPDNCDLTDYKAIKAANPALGVFRSLDDAMAQGERAKRMPSESNKYRQLILNQRVSRETPFVSRDLWDMNGKPPLPLDPTLPVYAGLDLSKTTDLTACVLMQYKNNAWNVHVRCWIPGDGLIDRSKTDRVPYHIWVENGYLEAVPGPVIDYEYVVNQLARDFAHLTFEQVGFDPWRRHDFEKELDRAGFELPIVGVNQKYRGISPCIDRMEAALLKGEIRHGNHPVLRMAAFNVAVATDGINRAFEKKKSTTRIDPLQAFAMCWHQESGEKETKKKRARIDLDSWISDPIHA